VQLRRPPALACIKWNRHSRERVVCFRDHRRITGTNTVTESVALPPFHWRGCHAQDLVENINPTGVFSAVDERGRSRRFSLAGLALVYLEGVRRSLVFQETNNMLNEEALGERPQCGEQLRPPS